MLTKNFWIAGLALTLSACGGGKDPLAQLCVDETAKRLDGQVYRLDEKELTKSKTLADDGTAKFKGAVILKPGTSGESKEAVDCTVAPASGDTPARVIGFQFTVEGSGLAPK